MDYIAIKLLAYISQEITRLTEPNRREEELSTLRYIFET